MCYGQNPHGHNSYERLQRPKLSRPTLSQFWSIRDLNILAFCLYQNNCRQSTPPMKIVRVWHGPQIIIKEHKIGWNLSRTPSVFPVSQIIWSTSKLHSSARQMFSQTEVPRVAEKITKVKPVISCRYQTIRTSSLFHAYCSKFVSSKCSNNASENPTKKCVSGAHSKKCTAWQMASFK